ncbi:MAG: cation diffusion facilitator family transporter, partial [Gemmatimonadota bacterium]
MHGTHAHVHMPRGPEAGRRLKIVLVLASAFVAVEVVAGLLSDSLALLADAGHTFTDIGAIALSLVAMRLALRPASPEKTFGYVRMEILAALVNGT